MVLQLIPEHIQPFLPCLEKTLLTQGISLWWVVCIVPYARPKCFAVNLFFLAFAVWFSDGTPPQPEQTADILMTPPLVAPKNDLWGTCAEIQYWWRITTWLWVVLLIEWRKWSTIQICVVTRHQCGTSALIPQTSYQWWHREMLALFCG